MRPFSSFPRSQLATIFIGVVIMLILLATDRQALVIDVEKGTSVSTQGISDRPTCLAADALAHGRAWCGTYGEGVFRTDDGGRSWRSVGLAGRLIMAIAASPVERDVVWVVGAYGRRSMLPPCAALWLQRHVPKANQISSQTAYGQRQQRREQRAPSRASTRFKSLRNSASRVGHCFGIV